MCHLCDALVNDLPQLVMADNRQLGGGHVDHCHQDAIAVLGNRIGPHGNFVSGVADAVPATRKVTRDEQVNGLVGVVVGEHQNITRCGAALHQPRDPRVDEAAPAEKLVDAPLRNRETTRASTADGLANRLGSESRPGRSRTSR